jgi:hypothetical protein
VCPKTDALGQSSGRGISAKGVVAYAGPSKQQPCASSAIAVLKGSGERPLEEASLTLLAERNLKGCATWDRGIASKPRRLDFVAVQPSASFAHGLVQ